MIKNILSVLLVSLLTLSSYGQDKKDHLLNSISFEKRLEISQGQLIDVRTADEFNQGTIEGAKNIDFMELDFIKEISKLEKNKPLYIFCKSGGRSAKAYELLKEVGFEKVYELEGGFNAWKEAHKN